MYSIVSGCLISVHIYRVRIYVRGIVIKRRRVPPSRRTVLEAEVIAVYSSYRLDMSFMYDFVNVTRMIELATEVFVAFKSGMSL